ncbi:MAG: phosphate/phosphite/phosphonate ABC transporter substrate-binding protein [Sulfurospirillum sp.]|nr:phosphate/phosphite/phosphonate ABC transporter substrate-binding protein [Sulfurospirillum sp.]
MFFDMQNLTSKVKFLTITLMLCFLSLNASAKEKIILGLTGTVFKDDLKNFMDWEKYLEQQSDFDVEILFSKNYEEMNTFIKDKRVDIAYVCNSSYTKLKQEGAGKLLAIPIVDGSDQYYSFIITKKTNPYNSLLDFKDAIFAFTDPQSNSGSIAPRYFLLSNDINMSAFFRSFLYTYEHGESIKAVIEGFVDGASVDSIVYTRFTEKYPKAIQEIKVIQVLGPYANSPIVARSTIASKTFQTLQKAFLNMHEDAYGKTILNKLSLDRFDTPSTQDYSNVADMLKTIEDAE